MQQAILTRDDHLDFATHYQGKARFHAVRAMSDRERGFFNLEPAMSAAYFADKARFHLFHALDMKAEG